MEKYRTSHSVSLRMQDFQKTGRNRIPAEMCFDPTCPELLSGRTFLEGFSFSVMDFESIALPIELSHPKCERGSNPQLSVALTKLSYPD